MEKEYQRLEAERLGEEQGTEENIADIATRVEELETKLDAMNERLEAKIDASQARLEAMLKQILAARPPISCTPPVSPRDNNPTVSVLLLIMADGPTRKTPAREGASPKLTLHDGGRVAVAVADEGCDEASAPEKEPLPSLGTHHVTTGAGPSSTVGPEHPVQVS